MKVEKNNVVALSYTLEVEGQIADSASTETPLEYIHGTGMLIPKFESEVEGKEPGETFEFTLSPEEGYGVYNSALCFNIPLASFEVDGVLREDLLKIGAIIPMLNGQGQVVQGRIAEIGTETVLMDFNHPMAGKTLNFCGTVVSVREATRKELEEGLHGEYLPHQGGCGGCHGKCKGEGGCNGEGECGKGDGCCKGEGCNCND